MAEKFIDTLTFRKINNLIDDAKNIIIFSSANLHEEVSLALLEASNKGVQIKVIIDPSEENCRNGLGDIKSIELLEKADIKIFEVKGNQISFIIADDIGYIFFPQSKIFIDEPKGPNAILMDDVTKLKIISQYYNPKSKEEKEKLIDTILDLAKSTKNEITSIIDSVQNSKSDITLDELDTDKLKKVKENLEINPPIQPDIKRKIETYTTKVQFVELKFEGSNFRSKKINIPNKALPFKDVELKKSLETKLSLFTDLENNSDIKRFQEISNKINNLRFHHKSENTSKTDKLKDAYLIPITCRNKSLIHVPRKKEFKEKLKGIEKEIEAFRKSTLETLEVEMLNRKDSIKNELNKFLLDNPPENFQNFSQDLFPRKIKDKIEQIVSEIKFPKVEDIVSDLKLKYNFYDLTLEDFKDEKLIEEFRKKGILTSKELDEIVSIKKVFEAAR